MMMALMGLEIFAVYILVLLMSRQICLDILLPVLLGFF